MIIKLKSLVLCVCQLKLLIVRVNSISFKFLVYACMVNMNQSITFLETLREFIIAKHYCIHR